MRSQDVISANPKPLAGGSATLPTHSEDGVDLTLIRWMLSLTPLERLLALQRSVESIQRLRDGKLSS
jgi:hypothetical protein